MANLSALSSITTSATALSNLVLVSPQKVVGYQPQNPPSKDGQPTQQPPALLFNYEGENTVKLESDITDHYVEDNTAVADQIALKPEMVTVHGFIGELTDIAPRALQPLKTIADKLTIISAYTPVISETALIAYNTAFQLYQVGANAVNAGVAAWSSLNNTGGTSVINGQGIVVQQNQTKQQLAFQQFYGYWKTRQLFTVQTPWAIFQDMAIKDLIAVQDAETRVVTDFAVTFKIIRKAETALNPGRNEELQGRLSFQGADTTDLGTSTPVQSQSLSAGLQTAFPVSF